MEYVVKEEARKVVERELKKTKQLRHAQVRDQTVKWTAEMRRKFEIEKEKQIQLLTSVCTAQAQANVMARIEQINIEHDLAMTQVGAAQRAAAELRDAQKIKELKRLKNVEIAKQRGAMAMKTHWTTAEKQKESHISVLQRKQEVRQAEDLKAKDLVERRPFSATNTASVTLREEKKPGPPEYQQSKSKSLRVAPSYQGQENVRKSPLKTKALKTGVSGKSSTPTKDRTGVRAKHAKKSKEDDTKSKPITRPPIGRFASEVERRQSGLVHSAPTKVLAKKTEGGKTKNVKEHQFMKKASKTKVKPVAYYDASTPNSEVKYMPPPGLAERIGPDEGTPNAWETADKLSRDSAKSLRDEEIINQQREKLTKHRGEKALERERLERELQQLTEELVKHSDGIEIPKYSLASAQLGLGDPEKQVETQAPKDSTNLPTEFSKSAVAEERKRSSSSVHKLSFESRHESESSSDSVTEYYDDSDVSEAPDEIAILTSNLFKTIGIPDRAETEVDSEHVPTKLSLDKSLEKNENANIAISSPVKEAESPQKTELPHSSATESYDASHTSSSKSHTSSKKGSANDANVLPKKSFQLQKLDTEDLAQKTPPGKVGKKHERKPKTEGQSQHKHKAKKETNTTDTKIATVAESPIAQPQQAKLSSGSTTEYYSPPYTSTPDTSKSRVNESSIFKKPMGEKEGKALRRYVGKMMQMRRESVEHLKMSTNSSSSSSDHSKIIADSFQSEWSSFVSSAQGSPASVSSNHAAISPLYIGGNLLSSVTEDETERSHMAPERENSTSGSTFANISLKFQPLSSRTSLSVTRRSQDRGNAELSTPFTRPHTSDTSLADLVRVKIPLDDHQMKDSLPYEFETTTTTTTSGSNDTSSDNKRSSGSYSSEHYGNYTSSSFSSNSKGNLQKTPSQHHSFSTGSDDRSLPDVSPVLRRLYSVTTTEPSGSSKTRSPATGQKNSTHSRPGSGGSSDKEVLRGTVNNSNFKTWESPLSQPPPSPVYNVTDHAALLTSVFGELRNQWANISIERPPWCK